MNKNDKVNERMLFHITRKGEEMLNQFPSFVRTIITLGYNPEALPAGTDGIYRRIDMGKDTVRDYIFLSPRPNNHTEFIQAMLHEMTHKIEMELGLVDIYNPQNTLSEIRATATSIEVLAKVLELEYTEMDLRAAVCRRLGIWPGIVESEWSEYRYFRDNVGFSYMFNMDLMVRFNLKGLLHSDRRNGVKILLNQ